jgi:predicted permease
VDVAAGRGFTASDGIAGSQRAVILADAYWRQRFAAAPDAIGRTVTLNGTTTATIVGVMPPGVRFPDEPLGFLRERADLWLAFGWEQARTDGRGNQNLGMVARLAQGLPFESADAQLDVVEGQFKAAFPNRYAGEERGWKLAAIPLRDQMVGGVRPALAVMFGAVGLVLLIACTNVANLLLARGAGRTRELAVRSALGASRGRLVRQLIAEAALLALLGTVGGGAAALAGIQLVKQVDPGSVPRLQAAALDLRVLGFAVGLTAVVALLVGLLPALRQSRTGPAGALSEAGARGSTSPASRRVRRGLVTAEVALAVIVLAGAGIVARSLAALQGTPTGFDGSRTVAFPVSAPRLPYDNAARVIDLHERVVARLAALPGVVRASAGYPLPMSGERWSGSFAIDGRAVPEGQPEPHAEFASVMPGYFEAVGITRIEGRTFEPADRRGAPSVVVIDESLARTHWPGESAIGKRIDTDGRLLEPVATVIGVVRHVRNGGPRDDGEPQIYLSMLQAPQRLVFYVAQTTGDPRPLVAAIRPAMRDVDPGLPLQRVLPMDELTGQMLASDRFNALLLSAFAAIALLLAVIGLYGVLSHVVAERTREIGIRLALGGRPAHVVRQVVTEGLALTAAGLAIGLLAAAALGRLLSGLVFAVEVVDPVTYAGIAVVLLAAALAAAAAPAVRATRVDPVDVLRV